MSRKKNLTTDPLRRFLKIGGLAGRVGASVVGDRILGAAQSEETRASGQTDNLVKNALRIVETLGELRGGAMKVGQMLSLHENLFPPEVAAVLGRLQQRAPSVPFEVMEFELREALPHFDDLFESIEPEAFAAASIGQVHRAILHDGREVAVKIQYPLIDQVIEADLDNLRTLFKRLLALFADMEFAPLWRELEARLREELDYETEAATLTRAAELYEDVEEIMIPRVIEEASTRRVLTMQYLPGLLPSEAGSSRYGEEIRDQWGQILFRFIARGLFVHGELHADPNFANFAFRDDGRMIVYDFGCVKKPPAAIANGYRETARAALQGEREAIPSILAEMGIRLGEGPLELSMIDPYLDLFDEIFREGEGYRFGEDRAVYDRLFESGMANLSAAREMQVPEDLIFVDRAIGGHFGNLAKLGSAGPWREMLQEILAEGD